MLTSPISRKLWSKFANASPEAIKANMPLVLKCARMIRKDCGYAECRRFLYLIFLSIHLP